MNQAAIYKSAQDASVNFVLDQGFEARYVQREAKYFICYLSSHTGCNKACRFCHLTQSGQTGFEPAGMGDYVAQAKMVLAHYDSLVAGGMTPAKWVNFNLMARGEPLSNSVVTADTGSLLQSLRGMAMACGLQCKLNLSSIFPSDFDLRQLSKIASVGEPGELVLFYSLYSLDRAFRKRWLPKAHDPMVVLEELARVQRTTGSEVVLHWAYIEGENDSTDDVRAIVDAVRSVGLVARFNLVRYNPYSQGQGREAGDDVIARNFGLMSEAMLQPGSRIVPRVGFDVKASCGMFVVPENA